MKTRRAAVIKNLSAKDKILSIANFPGLGTCTAYPPSLQSVTNEASSSCFVPDEVINSHARFK